MGVDACIYIKLKEGVDSPQLEQELPAGFRIVPADRFAVDGATHEIDNGARFYSPDYPRGSWPTLSGVLMLLLNSPDIQTVWYCGDGGEGFDGPWTIEQQNQYTTYFVNHGCREYFGPFPGRGEPA